MVQLLSLYFATSASFHSVKCPQSKTQQPSNDTATGWTPSTVDKVMKREAIKDATPAQMKRLEKVTGMVFEEGSDLAWARQHFQEDGTFGKVNRKGHGKCNLLVPTSEVGKFKSIKANGAVGKGIYDSKGKSFKLSSSMIGNRNNQAVVAGQKEVYDTRGQLYDSAASSDDNKATFLDEYPKVMNVVSKCEPDLFEKHNGKGVVISPSMHDPKNAICITTRSSCSTSASTEVTDTPSMKSVRRTHSRVRIRHGSRSSRQTPNTR